MRPNCALPLALAGKHAAAELSSASNGHLQLRTPNRIAITEENRREVMGQLKRVASENVLCRGAQEPDEPGFRLRRIRTSGRKRSCHELSSLCEDRAESLEPDGGDWLACVRQRLSESGGAGHEEDASPEGSGPSLTNQCRIVPSQPRTPLLARTSGSATLFPLFRPVSQTKVVHLIRHGESEYNRAQSNSKSWDEVLIFDPCLTSKGQSQARSLKYKLQTMSLGGALWVVSPLTRAIQTFLLACPDTPLLKARANGETCAGVPPQVAVLPLISEYLMTAGDIGRAPCELARDFPELADEILKINKEVWWDTSRGANCAKSQRFAGSEPAAAMRERAAAFRKWVTAQKESVIVAVGHSMFWRNFLPDGKTLRNGEMATIRM